VVLLVGCGVVLFDVRGCFCGVGVGVVLGWWCFGVLILGRGFVVICSV